MDAADTRGVASGQEAVRASRERRQ